MARVPYDEGVADVLPRTEAPNDLQRIEANPAQFGGLIGQVEQRLGAGATAASKFFGEVAADQVTNQYLDGSNKILFGTGQVDPSTGTPDRGFYGLAGEDAVRAQPDVTKQITQLRQQLRSNLATPEQQQLFDQNTRFMQFRMQGEIGRHYDEQFKTYAGKTNSDGYQTVLNSIALRPQDDAFAQTMIHQALTYRVKNLQLQGQTSPEAMQQAQLETARDVSEARIFALAPTDPNAAATLFNRDRPLLQGSKNYDAISARIDRGTTESYEKYAATDFAGAQARFKQDRDSLSPGVVANLSAYFDQHSLLNQQRDLINAERQIAYDNKLKEQNAQIAGNKIVAQMIADPTKIDPNSIANDPSLRWEEKLHLNDVLQQQLTKPKGDLLAQSYGAGFTPAMTRVLASPDDPTRITDPNELWRMAAQDKDITPSGIGTLTSLIEGRRTPEGEAASKLQSSVLAYAKHQLSFEADYGTFKLRDPKGEDSYNIGFVPAFLKYWNDGIKNGKSPYELSDREAIDKVISPFKRSPAELARDQLSSDSGQSGLPKGAPDISTQAGIIAAYQAGQLSRDDAAKRLVAGKFATAPTPEPSAPFAGENP